MAIRNIKDAKDLSTNELIYFKGHAQATFMSDGRTVEEAVNSISDGPSNVATINLSSNLSGAGGTFTAEEQAIIFDNTIGTIIFNSSNGTNTWVMTRSRTNPPQLTTIPGVFMSGLRYMGSAYGLFVTLSVLRDGTYAYTERKIATPVQVVDGVVSVAELTLQPNTYVTVKDYQAGQGLLVKLATPTDNTILNEYTLEINWVTGSNLNTTGSIAFESSDIMWLNNETPTFTAGRTYRISIINNCAKSECFYQSLVVG